MNVNNNKKVSCKKKNDETMGSIMIVLNTRSYALTYDLEVWQMQFGHSEQLNAMGHASKS